MVENPNIILKRDNHPTDLALKCHQLLQQEKYVDVTLAVEEGSLKAHRLVLSWSSDYFAVKSARTLPYLLSKVSYFLLQEVLSQQPADSHVIVILDNVSFSNLQLLVEVNL